MVSWNEWNGEKRTKNLMELKIKLFSNKNWKEWNWIFSDIHLKNNKIDYHEVLIVLQIILKKFKLLLKNGHHCSTMWWLNTWKKSAIQTHSEKQTHALVTVVVSLTVYKNVNTGLIYQKTNTWSFSFFYGRGFSANNRALLTIV